MCRSCAANWLCSPQTDFECTLRMFVWWLVQQVWGVKCKLVLFFFCSFPFQKSVDDLTLMTIYLSADICTLQVKQKSWQEIFLQLGIYFFFFACSPLIAEHSHLYLIKLKNWPVKLNSLYICNQLTNSTVNSIFSRNTFSRKLKAKV